MQEFRSFVALGDSFTEGVGDPRADGSGCRGWADRFALHLAASAPGLRYANLAIRGKLLREVLDEQVPAAIELAPELVSLAAGGNDLLRPRTDPDEVAVTFETAVARLTAAGATVLTFTGFDPKAFPLLRLIRGKSAVLTMAIRDIASRHGCLVADLWTMRILTDRRLWTPDRLHLTPDGHRRVALLACEVAGVPVAGDWRAPLADLTGSPALPGPAGVAAAWLAARWNDVEWLSEHAAPYLSRRLHGVSSGDSVTPKRPSLTLVLPAADGLPPGPGVLPASAAVKPKRNSSQVTPALPLSTGAATPRQSEMATSYRSLSHVDGHAAVPSSADGHAAVPSSADGHAAVPSSADDLAQGEGKIATDATKSSAYLPGWAARLRAAGGAASGRASWSWLA